MDEHRPPEPPEPPRPDVRRSGEMLTGVRAGDRRLRVARAPETVEIPVRPLTRRRTGLHPAVVFVLGFAGMIALGTPLLMLPAANATGAPTRFLDAFFTATSAVCVTGLVVVDTATHWSGFGQVIILVLIQLGGFGFMTSSTLLLLLLRRQVTLRERILLKEALGVGGLNSVLYLARKVVAFTLIVEAVGAVILTIRFSQEMDLSRAAWWGLFHGISAFNNAGFDLTGGFQSLIPFAHDPLVLLPIAVLLMLGGISYTVVEDLLKHARRRPLALDTKLVLVTTLALVVTGMVGLLFTERDNAATLGGMELPASLLNAFFHSVSPRTAGFNSLDLSQMTEHGLLLTMALMFIGGASGSTAGGIKVQTFSLLFFAILSTVRGSTDVHAFKKRVPLAYVLRGMAVALLSLAVVFGVSFALESTDRGPLVPVLFEAFSAFGTVGLTAGLTPDTSDGGRVILALTMFAGRLGPLTLVLALSARERRSAYRWSEEAVKIG